MRMQSILTLTDFSSQAEHGLDRAAALAAAHGAQLRILYACETPPLQLSDPVARLEQRARQLARRHGVVVSTIAGTGRLLEDCLTEAARADLMVAHRRMYRDGAVLPRRQLLYPLLRRLETQGLLASEWNTGHAPPRRYYRLSAEGKRAYAALADAWRDQVRVMGGFLDKETK